MKTAQPAQPDPTDIPLEGDQERAGPIDVRLFTIPGSHPGVAVQLMLEHKDIPFKRTDLLPVVSWGVLKALRFPRVTVPAMSIDGRRVQGSLEIARELERIEPDPPLFPVEPTLRAKVEEAERFGDEELQQGIRRPPLVDVSKEHAGASQLPGGCEDRPAAWPWREDGRPVHRPRRPLP